VRATWLTDIHLNFLDPRQREAFYARARAERPDALLVGGDIGEAPSVAGFVDELGAIAPTWFVLGNHDYYGASIADVRARMPRDGRARWLPACGPVVLASGVVLVGVDGWGDARCGDLASRLRLSDWDAIHDFHPARGDREARNALLQGLGAREADALRATLAAVPACDTLVVLTHVPPFEDACVYDGARSSPDWLPWFTCIAVGEVLLAHARAHASREIIVLCGHTHGVGRHRPLRNLDVRTGGWPPSTQDYGNPIVQETISLGA
jgi:predicted phosphohydrolase